VTAPDPRSLARLRDALNAGRDADAEAIAATILAQAPGHAPTLAALSLRARLRGDFGLARELARKGLEHDPRSSLLLFHLGAAHEAADDLVEAESSLRAAIEADADNALARFWLGGVLQRIGHHDEAISAWMQALACGERTGFLRAMANGPGEVRRRIEAAQDGVLAARASALDDALRPLRERHGKDVLDRVERAFAGYLGGEAPQPTHPLQQPSFLFVPGLPDQAWWERGDFPFLASIEAHTDAIRAELLAVLADEDGLAPYVDMPDDAPAAPMWRTLNRSPRWSGYHLYRHGERIEAHARRCPRTMAALDALPLLRIPGHGPEALFSVLRPGTHIPPHTGVINGRLTVHLPLIVPPDCGALAAAREPREWREGECLAFDDSFVHEAWNRSDHTRAVLIFDVWNPGLSAAEREALSAGIAAIGEFHRRHGGADPTREAEH
jgi:aspartate beta-hydroxylase